MKLYLVQMFGNCTGKKVEKKVSFRFLLREAKQENGYPIAREVGTFDISQETGYLLLWWAYDATLRLTQGIIFRKHKASLNFAVVHVRCLLQVY